MAKIQLATPFDETAGKLSSTDRIVMRTRYGKTEAYTIRNPYRGPFSESQQTTISAFSQAVSLCKTEMSNPDRLAYWQDSYARYCKAARRNPTRANARFLGTTSDKFYLTLRGFIIASLSAQLRSA